jgi:hypothetical protein
MKAFISGQIHTCLKQRVYDAMMETKEFTEELDQRDLEQQYLLEL